MQNASAPTNGPSASTPDVAPGEPRLVLRYRSSVRDQIHVAMVTARRSVPYVAFGALLVVVGVGNAILLGDLMSLWFALIGLALVMGVFSVPFILFGLWRQPNLRGADWETVLGTTGISSRTKSLAYQAEWSYVSAVQETDRVFIFFTPGGALFESKRILSPSDTEQLRALLREVGVKIVGSNPAWRVIVAIAIVVLVLVAVAAAAFGTAYLR